MTGPGENSQHHVVVAGRFLVATVLLGLAMRWDMVTGWMTSWGLLFPNARHAHSHAGFYGVLTLGWWAVCQQSSMPVMGRTGVAVHVAASSLASLLFAVMGYRVPTIVLSTVVASCWVLAAVRILQQPKQPQRWMSCVPWGVFLGVMLVPPIAVTASKHPLLSRQLAHLFIATMLLSVFVPVCWDALRVPRRLPVGAYLVSAVLGALGLVMEEHLGPASLAGPVLLGVTMFGVLWPSRGMPPWLRLGWLLVPVMLLAFPWVAGAGGDALRLGGVHALVLGPVLLSLVHVLAPGRVPAWLPVLYVVSLGAMLLAIVLPAWVAAAADPWIVAVASSAFVAAVLVAWRLVMRVPART